MTRRATGRLLADLGANRWPSPIRRATIEDTEYHRSVSVARAVRHSVSVAPYRSASTALAQGSLSPFALGFGGTAALGLGHAAAVRVESRAQSAGELRPRDRQIVGGRVSVCGSSGPLMSARLPGEIDRRMILRFRATALSFAARAAEFRAPAAVSNFAEGHVGTAISP